MEISDDLMHLPKRAAEYIAEHGWTQGTVQDNVGHVCLTGALQKVSENGLDLGIAVAVLGNHGYGMGWNDQPGRTVGEVTTALHSVIITEDEITEVFGSDWVREIEHHRERYARFYNSIMRIMER